MYLLANSLTSRFNGTVDQSVFGVDLNMAECAIASITLVLVLLLIWFIPTLVWAPINAYLRRRIAIERSASKYRKLALMESPIKTTLRILLVATYIAFIILFFELGMATSLDLPTVKETNVGHMIAFLITYTFVVLFTSYFLHFIVKNIFLLLAGHKLKKYVVLREIKSLVRPMKIELYLAGIPIGFAVAGLHMEHYGNGISGFIVSVYIATCVIIGFWILARLILFFLHLTTMSPEKMAPQVASTLTRGIKYFIILLGVALALAVMGVSFETVAAFFAVISVALVFGIQTTVADIMSGILLSADKPFKVGDRIRVGQAGRETWGDVTEVGVRSCKILTTENETVVVPNHQIAQNEIWNFTKDSPMLGLIIEIGISYDSDWRLSEKIMLEIANNHPYVLRIPRPYVLMDSYGASSVNLMLWCWIPDARDKPFIKSDLLKAIKDAFDQNGIEIPYSYSTVTYKKELPLPKQMTKEDRDQYKTPRRYPSRGADYFEFGDWVTQDSRVTQAHMPNEHTRILVPTAGGAQVVRNAEYVTRLARKVGASVTALYVVQQSTRQSIERGISALEEFNKAGKKQGIMVATLIEEGDVVEKILETIDKKKISLLVLGSSEKNLMPIWGREDINTEVLQQVDIPTIIIPPDSSAGDIMSSIAQRIKAQVGGPLRKPGRSEAYKNNGGANTRPSNPGPTSAKQGNLK